MASLGKDLAQIRKERNISLDEVYEATKIPKRIIRSIEDDSIFSDFEENSTYIRSYVRSYAKALSIDERQIVYALNKQAKDRYSGSLQKLMQEPPAQPLYDERDDKPESEQEPQKREEPVQEESQESVSDEKAQPVEKQATEKSQKKPGIRSVDWADMGKQFQPLKTAKSRTGIGLLAILLLLAASGGVFYFYFYESTPPNISNNQNAVNQQETPQTVNTDSPEINIVPSTENDTSALTSARESNLQNEGLESLPDTLSILLYAAYGKLEPVRVYTDIMDNVNPYWIEEGDAFRFNFVNDINIRGQLSRIVLFMNGHVIQDFREKFYNPETRLIEINRSYFEGEPKWLQPPPDSHAINAPPPNIKERPTFN